MRSSWLLLFLSCGFLACAHKKPPPAPPPEPPKGDLLRFKAAAGEEPKAKVTLLIDQEVMAAQGGKGSSRHIVLNFGFAEEEKVDAVSPDGTLQLSGRMVDVAGTASQGATQPQVDDFSLALDELKIQFRRSPRGEVAAITMAGVRPPLDESTARMVLNAIYSAARGPILPEGLVEPGASWQVQTQVPTPGGATAEATYSYKYAAKEGGVATISGEGTLDSKSGGGTTKHMSGKDLSEYKVEVATGHLLSSTVDVTRTVEDQIPGQQTMQVGLRSHIRVVWELVAARGAAK
jgi:hypothetical protein